MKKQIITISIFFLILSISSCHPNKNNPNMPRPTNTPFAATSTITPTCASGGNKIQNLTISPSTVLAGQNITITFQFKGTNTGCKLAYFAALSNKCYMQNAGTAGQAILVNEAGINIACCNAQVNSGRASQCNGDSAWHNNTDASCGMEAGGASIYMTVPSYWVTGYYYVLVGVRECNVYVNPAPYLDDIISAAFTVSP